MFDYTSKVYEKWKLACSLNWKLKAINDGKETIRIQMNQTHRCVIAFFPADRQEDYHQASQNCELSAGKGLFIMSG